MARSRNKQNHILWNSLAAARDSERRRRSEQLNTAFSVFGLCFLPFLYSLCFVVVLSAIRPSFLPCFVSRGGTFLFPPSRTKPRRIGDPAVRIRACDISSHFFLFSSPLFSRSLSPSWRVSFQQPRPFDFSSPLTDPFDKTRSSSIPFLYLDDANDGHATTSAQFANPGSLPLNRHRPSLLRLGPPPNITGREHVFGQSRTRGLDSIPLGGRLAVHNELHRGKIRGGLGG